MRFNEQHVNPKVIEIDHHFGQYERSCLTTAYHKYILKQSVKLGGIQPGMSVLDYGCGGQVLRHFLPSGVKYIGYDIVPEFSDVDNIREHNYDVIFAIQVLQYPDKTGLKELSNLYARLSNRLVVMVPSDNKFKRFLDVVLGLKEDNKSFLSKPSEIYQTMGDLFRCEKVKTIFGVGEISVWKRKQ